MKFEKELEVLINKHSKDGDWNYDDYMRGMYKGIELAERRKNNMEEKLAKLKELLAVQGKDGNWNYDDYMHGMYNGMELAVAVFENRPPVYK